MACSSCGKTKATATKPRTYTPAKSPYHAPAGRSAFGQAKVKMSFTRRGG